MYLLGFKRKCLAILLACLLLLSGMTAFAAEDWLAPAPSASDEGDSPFLRLLDFSAPCGWSADYHFSRDSSNEQVQNSVTSGGILPGEAFYVTLNSPDLPKITLYASEDGLLLRDDTTGAWSELTWMGAPITLDTLGSLVPYPAAFGPIPQMLLSDDERAAALAMLTEDLNAIWEKLSPHWESLISGASVELLSDKMRSESTLQIQSDDLNALCLDVKNFLDEALYELYDPVSRRPSEFVRNLNYGELYEPLLIELRKFLIRSNLFRTLFPPFQLTVSEHDGDADLWFSSGFLSAQGKMTFDRSSESCRISGSIAVADAAPIRFEGSLGNALWTIDFESSEMAGNILLNLPVDGRSSATATLSAYPIYDGTASLDDLAILSLNLYSAENRVILSLTREARYYDRYCLDLQAGDDFLSAKLNQYGTYSNLSTLELTLQALDEATFQLSLQQSLPFAEPSKDALVLHLTEPETFNLPTSDVPGMEIDAAYSLYFEEKDEPSAQSAEENDTFYLNPVATDAPTA